MFKIAIVEYEKVITIRLPVVKVFCIKEIHNKYQVFSRNNILKYQSSKSFNSKLYRMNLRKRITFHACIIYLDKKWESFVVNMTRPTVQHKLTIQ